MKIKIQTFLIPLLFFKPLVCMWSSGTTPDNSRSVTPIAVSNNSTPVTSRHSRLSQVTAKLNLAQENKYLREQIEKLQKQNSENKEYKLYFFSEKKENLDQVKENLPKHQKKLTELSQLFTGLKKTVEALEQENTNLRKLQSNYYPFLASYLFLFGVDIQWLYAWLKHSHIHFQTPSFPI